MQQLREAFPFEPASRFLIFDRDEKYGIEVPAAVRSLALYPYGPRSRALAERGCGALGRELPPGPARSCDRHQRKASEEAFG